MSRLGRLSLSEQRKSTRVDSFDTNVLLGLLLNDDRHQAQKAQALIDQSVSRSDKVLLPNIVLCEIERVLSSFYKVPRPELADTIRRMINSQVFVFQDRTAVVEALGSYEIGRADFSDYLIGTSAARVGAVTTYTFDRALHRAEGFMLAD